MAKVKIHVRRPGYEPDSEAVRKRHRIVVRERELKEAMGDFDKIEVAEPAVRPKPEVRRAIRKAVRAYYRRDALERA